MRNGKTHLLTGLCVAACRQKRRVRFTTAAALVNELVEAKHQLQLRRVMARWSRYDLIAIDEVGYVPLAEVGAEFLFQVIAERAERTAVIVTTKPAVFRMDASHPECSVVQGTARSNHRSSAHSGNRHRVLPLPPNHRQTEERRKTAQPKLSRGNAGPWKAWKTTQVFHASHRPWKSRNPSGIPTFPPL